MMSNERLSHLAQTIRGWAKAAEQPTTGVGVAQVECLHSYSNRRSRCRGVEVNTDKVFAEVLLWDDEICRRVGLDKKYCRDQTLDLPTLVFYQTFP